MNKTALSIIILGLLIGVGIVVYDRSKNSDTGTVGVDKIQSDQIPNSEIKDGIQYITIDAKGGYSPRVSTGKGGIPTKLIVKTNGTYDCSAALSIRSVGFQKILQKTGEEVIDLGTPKAGTPVRGVCGMGMYSFVVNFE